ncbi:hypothetical protein LOAG_18069 [Loa loa]|uniref:Uncharacterized protein n=1 Tax=Loa loa TaxID=7209 RepID=A0A1S0UG19_LOALO|nr:hypothetical protein LOAG_18069 [Loa loa]EJD74640.1 hypothetical protein LOAG_18069 [Loa loa]
MRIANLVVVVISSSNIRNLLTTLGTSRMRSNGVRLYQRYELCYHDSVRNSASEISREIKRCNGCQRCFNPRNDRFRSDPRPILYDSISLKFPASSFSHSFSKTAGKRK